ESAGSPARGSCVLCTGFGRNAADRRRRLDASPLELSQTGLSGCLREERSPVSAAMSLPGAVLKRAFVTLLRRVAVKRSAKRLSWIGPMLLIASSVGTWGQAAPQKPDLGPDLFLATGKNDLPRLRSLLKQGADPNAKNFLSFTPLLFAAICGHEK